MHFLHYKYCVIYCFYKHLSPVCSKDMMSLAVIFLLAFSCCKGSQYQGYWVIFNFLKVIPSTNFLGNSVQQSAILSSSYSSYSSLSIHDAGDDANPRLHWFLLFIGTISEVKTLLYSGDCHPPLRPLSPSAGSWTWSSLASPQPQRRTHGCRGCGPGCVAHCSCPEMAGVRWPEMRDQAQSVTTLITNIVRWAMAMGLPAEEVLRIGAHPLRNHKWIRILFNFCLNYIPCV